MEPLGNGVRRTVEVGISGLLCVALLPLVLLTAIGSALALRTWPFFTQDRVGLGGEPFRFLKIRTLPVDVPAYIDKLSLDHRRIPAFCELIRRLHIDELPQLLLVLTGRMSLVGPRPEMGHLHERLPVGFRELRTSVRPGCTGLWQIGAACPELIGASPEYDRYYVTHRTVALDLWILGRTIATMMGSKRYVTLDDVPPWAVKTAEARPRVDVEPARRAPVTADR